MYTECSGEGGSMGRSEEEGRVGLVLLLMTASDKGRGGGLMSSPVRQERLL